MRVILLAGALLLAATAALRAQADAGDAPAAADDAPVMLPVEVVVTAVSGASVYLDQGREAHIEPGDTLVLHPLDGATVVGSVQSVSRTSSRAELLAGAPPAAIGDRGEVLVPESRIQPAPAADAADDADAPASSVPEHPPWAAGTEDFDTGQPLLAPAGGAGAGAAMLVHGRWFTQFNGSWDTENDNSFELFRTGLDLSVENPYGHDGLFHLAGDLSHKSSDVSGSADDATADGRLDRFSYRWGGTREEPDRIEVGRFLQHEFPELGVLDGVEASRRTEAGNLYGGSFGYMPLPFPSMQTGADLQTAVFFRTGSQSGRAEPYELGVAYQNTWHQGAQDRNLFVGTLDARLSDTVSVSADAAVDYYGPGGDTIHADGLQVTDALARTVWRVSPDSGVGLHAGKRRWPEMKREEFGELTPQQIADSEVTRVGADGWQQLSRNLRLDGRLDAWQDHDDSGSSGSVRAALRDVAWEHGEVALDLFTTNGANTDGGGVRVSVNRAFDGLGFGTLSWEASSYSGGTSLDGNADTSQQALRASLDTQLDDGWSLSLYGERRFGDDQASYAVGFYLQERF